MTSGCGRREVTLTRPVQVMVKVTDHFKMHLAAEVREAIRHLEIEIQQIDLQVKRLGAEPEKITAQQAQAVRQHLEGERQKRAEKKSELLDRLKEIARLENGSEVAQGTVEGLVGVSVGDNWDKVMHASVVVEDGIVVDIRCGQKNQGNPS